MRIKMLCIGANEEKLVDLGMNGKLVRLYLAKLTPAQTSPQMFFGTFELQSTEPIPFKLREEYEIDIPISGIKLVSKIIH